MRSTPLVASLLPAVAVATSWSRLEDPRRGQEAALVVALGLVPSLLRPPWARAAAAAGALLASLWIAFSAPPWDLVLLRGLWWRRVGAGLDTGLQDFGDIFVPFDPVERWEVHGLVLLAMSLLTLAISLCAAAGRPLLAVAIVLVGAGVPVTLLEERAGIALGALVLASCLWLVAASRSGWPRGAAGGVVVGAALTGVAVVAAAAGVTPGAAAVDWREWKLYERARGQVGVGYVWDANYDGIRFPPRRTTVLRVRGPGRGRYWRASTLDAFDGVRWREYLSAIRIHAEGGRLPADPLLPTAAYDQRRWVRQQVEVAALRSNRLPAVSSPIALSTSSFGQLTYFAGGVVGATEGVEPGQRYTVWSYAPRPTAAQLAASNPSYPESVSPYLGLAGATLPAFADPRRAGMVAEILAAPYHPELAAYGGVWEQARRLTRSARTPYAAALALERWFRSTGGFTYDEEPPRSGSAPPLVDFVLRGKRGYCQHFAGAMALMLRLVGVPARVAVGFTSGSLRDGVWTVTDHDAHAWVEVWFDGWGWLPFDPTPGRGALAQSYTVASSSADAALRLGGRPFVPQGQAPQAPGDPARSTAVDDGRERWLLAVLVVALGLLAGIGLLKEGRRRWRYRSRDPRRVASAARADLAGRLRDQGVALPAPATLADVARALRRVGVNGTKFAAVAAHARYGPPAAATAAAADARREARAIARALRRALPGHRRVRGYLSLRSLRGLDGPA